jgi:hypothetical protein
VLLLDPHGDLAQDALGLVPIARHNHVCCFDLGDLAHPVGLNILEDVHPDDRATHAENVVSAMRAIWKESWGDRLERILRHATAALIETPGASLVLLPRLLTDQDFRQRIVPRLSNPMTRSFFEKQFDVWRDQFRDEVIVSTLNRIEAFTFSPAVRNVIGQAKSTLHFEHALERGRIVLVNLAIGTIGEGQQKVQSQPQGERLVRFARAQARATEGTRYAVEVRRHRCCDTECNQSAVRLVVRPDCRTAGRSGGRQRGDALAARRRARVGGGRGGRQFVSNWGGRHVRTPHVSHGDQS